MDIHSHFIFNPIILIKQGTSRCRHLLKSGGGSRGCNGVCARAAHLSISILALMMLQACGLRHLRCYGPLK